MKTWLILALVWAFEVQACGGYVLQGRKSLNDRPWGWTINSEQVYRGKVSQRFEVRSGDCGQDDRGWSDCRMDRERSEIFVDRPQLVPGRGYWIDWRVYLPWDFATHSRVRTTLGQVHQVGGPRGQAGGMASNPPLLQFDLVKDQYRLCWHRLSGSKTDVQDRCEYFALATLDDMRGQWTHLRVWVNTDHRLGGAKVWVNGQLRADITEPLTEFTPRHYYFKYGIYRSFVSREGRALATQIAYYDEVRIADRERDLNCRSAVD